MNGRLLHAGPFKVCHPDIQDAYARQEIMNSYNQGNRTTIMFIIGKHLLLLPHDVLDHNECLCNVPCQVTDDPGEIC